MDTDSIVNAKAFSTFFIMFIQELLHVSRAPFESRINAESLRARKRHISNTCTLETITKEATVLYCIQTLT